MSKLMSFSDNEIRQRIKMDNPWWETNNIPSIYKNMQPRKYIQMFSDIVLKRTVNRAVVLMGPRRVGKTVIIYHLIQEIINKGENPKKVLYLSIDAPIYNSIPLEKLLNIFTEGKEIGKAGIKYVFFDEIQYLKNWEIHLKSLVDSYPNIKFIVSGSAAAALKLKSIESGAGRFTEFMLPPLTFYEYIELKNIKIKFKEDKTQPFSQTTDIELLNKHFIDYINYGGYPEVALSKEIQEQPDRFIKNDIIDKVLLKDLPGLYGIQDIQELNSLFSVLCYNSGNEISLEQLSQNSGVAKNTIIKYLSYLEAAFLIKRYNRTDQNAKKFKRATFFKVYLANPTMRSATFTPIDSENEFIGNMVETAIFAQWVHDPDAAIYYSRWNKGEIDLLYMPRVNSPDWAVEIKWSDRYIKRPEELREQLKFCENMKLKELLVTSRSKFAEQTIYGIDIEYVPAAIYCYTVGKNLIRARTLGFSLKGRNE